MVASVFSDKKFVAYFSMEIALESEMPSYSGGLGVLAGDTLRAAADLGLPMCAVSLLYRKGYFRQSIDDNGIQHESSVSWNPEVWLKPVGEKTSIEIEGQKVAIKAWRYDIKGETGHILPVFFLDTDVAENSQVLTTWSMGVSLPAHQRGTHMSRFLTELTSVADRPMSLSGHFEFCQKLLPILNAQSAEIKTSFSWFRKVFAPVSGLAGLLECKVSFISLAGTSDEKSISIAVPAKALCPCSKAISERGAHNQRSEISVELNYEAGGKTASINQIFSLLEMSASSPVYPVLKRDDEKFVTESAYDNPVFVEDIVRRAANRLVEVSDIRGFRVQAVNYESIHAHDCFARISHRIK